MACCQTVLGYDQEDEWRVWRLVGYMLLALAGLGVHEVRPYKRMTYEDRAREQQQQRPGAAAAAAAS